MAVTAELAPGERLLAWAACDDGGHAVASDRGLHVPARGGEPHLVPWERVDRAAWDRDDGVLTVVEAVPSGRPYRHRLAMEDPGNLTIVVRERVNATVVLSRRVELDGTRGITVVARRPPGTDRLAWSVVLDRGIDASEPTMKARVDLAVTAVRAEIGE